MSRRRYQSLPFPLAVALALILMPAIASGFNTDPAWNYALFREVGVGGILVAQNGSQPEIYLTGDYPAHYWIALRYNASTHDYDQVYVSSYYSSGISCMKTADIYNDGIPEIIIATSNGQIQFFDQAAKVLQRTIATALNITDLAVADIDGDGGNEIVLSTSSHLYVYSANGTSKWDIPGIGGSSLILAQMDSDAALEIATIDGHVVDGATHSIQWDWPYGFGYRFVAFDIDGDGMAELIDCEYGDLVFAYDVDKGFPKWSMNVVDASVILVADVDGDKSPEIVIGQHSWGSLLAFDSATHLQKWSVPNPDNGFTNIAAGDVDGDGSVEVLWGNDANSTGPDYLHMANMQTGSIKWRSIDFMGPFIGPEVGDLDGDGRSEVVIASRQSNSVYGNGRILVFDALDRRLRAISDPVGGYSYAAIDNLQLRDVNGDGRQEILLALSSGNVAIYSFDTANSFTLQWKSTSDSTTSAGYASVEAADIDGDQQMEIIAGSGATSNGGGYLYAFDYTVNPGTLKWKSASLNGSIVSLALADPDQDGMKEIIGMADKGNVYIFNGTSKELEAQITGPFTAMRVQSIGGIPSIALGKSTGYLMIYQYSSGTYTQTYNRRLITTSIDGFTIDSRNRAWLSTTGPYLGLGTLREMSLDGAALATYTGYGRVFGLRIAFLPSSNYFFTAGSYSVNAYRLAGISTSSVDMDGDGRSDLSVWRPDSGFWYSLSSKEPALYSSSQWGILGDPPVPGDYDGDSKMDLAVYRPAEGAWYILSSLTPGNYTRSQWGLASDRPVQGDYDGDGKTDIAVWRPEDGLWFILPSRSPGTYISAQWGLASDIPVPGDYDGDGKFDFAVWRPSDGSWYIVPSGNPGTYRALQWGFTNDVPVPGDFDGDGMTDIAVWRPEDGNWYMLSSATPGNYTCMSWGSSGDIPVPGDFDGDGKSDIAVWRQETGTWYILPSASPGTYTAVAWGSNGDIPISFINPNVNVSSR
jgi:hypothetical protein